MIEKTNTEETTEETKTKKPSVAANAAWMASGTMISRISGFLRESVLFAYFDRYVTDAFVVAFRLPNMFRRLLGEGSLAVSFIPVFMDQLALRGGAKIKGESSDELDRLRSQPAYDLACSVFSLLLMVLMILSVAGVVFMETIIGLLASGDGFQSVPGKVELTVKMGRIMFSFIFLVSLYAFFTAILQSLKRFAVAAVAPALLNIAIIAACYLPKDWFAYEGEVLAWAVLVGGFLQAAVLIPLLIRSGYLPRPKSFIGHSGVRRVMLSMGPSLLGMGVLQVMAMVNVYFASRLPQGSHSYIYLADRILELPLSLFAVSLGSAMLPSLASHWSLGEKKEMVDACHRYIKMVFLVSVPSAFGLWFLGQPMVETLFMRGEVTLEQASIAAELIQIYAFTLLSASGVRVLAPSFYAIKDTKLPAIAAGLALVFHIALAWSLLPTYGLKGLVGSTVASSFVNLAFLAVFFNKKVGTLRVFELLKSVLIYSVCAAIMAGVIHIYWPLFKFLMSAFYGPAAPIHVTQNPAGVQILRAVVLLFTIGCGAIAYFVAACVLRVTEARTILLKLGRRFR